MVEIREGQSVCYLTNNFRQWAATPEVNKDILKTIWICPEAQLNGEQIINWVEKLKKSPSKFYTNSLFLVRELQLQKVDVLFINFNFTQNEVKDPVTNTSTWVSNVTITYNADVDSIGQIELLDRELEQSDRYIKFNDDNSKEILDDNTSPESTPEHTL